MPLTLPTKSDLVLVYGDDNINRWADANNDGIPQRTAERITYAIAEAKRYVLGRLAERFPVNDWTAYPEIVFNLIAQRAGIELYSNPRGLTDGDSSAKALLAKSEQIEARIEQILAGQLKLIDLEEQPVSTPFVNNSTASFYSRSNQQVEGIPCVTPCGGFYAEN